ncbi:regulator of G protein signaling domain-containing protein [Zychaea mexicana]|uniref:regulator of G protein signaling domain-containing protein n=1 Tax=Zychaea mexicana TaxID=64656 RepID=UPI0022FF10A8|nr:regulator of G protein signaling domain-containing protein [Zychaea mexicana]KAI9495581.1 regulator of G protein signaling domain-containing protein [Zychaea mexicana]
MTIYQFASEILHECSMSQQAYTSMMKFTMDGRPYVKDIHDLFGALMVQIRFETHRYLFRNYQNAFSSEDAIQVLGNLKFSQTVRVPDPNNPSRLLRTTTTTTFNMARDMARALCQQFAWARLMENAVDQQVRSFKERGLWRLTHKGVAALQDFCVRTEADMPLGAIPPTVNTDAFDLIEIGRSKDYDQMLLTRQTVSSVFRIMVRSLPLEGVDHHQQQHHHQQEENASTKASSKQKQQQEGDVLSSSSSSFIEGGGLKRRESVASSTSSVSSASTNPSHGAGAPFAMSSRASSVTTGTTMSEKSRLQLLDNRLLNTVANMKRQHQSQQRRSSAKSNNNVVVGYRAIFPTLLCCDWITENCTVANRDESEELVTEFYRLGWIEHQDHKRQSHHTIQAHKNVLVVVTAKGRAIAETEAADQDTSNVYARRPKNNHHSSPRPNSSVNVDQQEGLNGRLKQILDDPQLRSLFKDFLRSNFCEENLDFWIDYATLRRKCRNQSPAMPSQNQKDLLEDAYSVWSTYLAPHALSELNVDHLLRQEMARLVNATVTIAQDPQSQRVIISTHSTSQSLRMMLKWFDKVEEHILRLMASDSVPKFIRTSEYRQIMDAREPEHTCGEERRDSAMSSSSSVSVANNKAPSEKEEVSLLPEIPHSSSMLV